MPLQIILSIGAISTGALALITLFATSLLEMPGGREDSNEVIEMKTSLKRRRQAIVVFGVISALFAAALVLTWLPIL